MYVVVVPDTVCSHGTFVYAYEGHCRTGVLSVVSSALVTVVLDSARSTDTVLCCIWDHYLTACCRCTVIVVHGLARFACADWPVLCACCVVVVTP